MCAPCLKIPGQMISRFQFVWNRLSEILWFRPLLAGVFSLLLILAAAFADTVDSVNWLAVSVDSVVSLLEIMASSMLVIATFAVGSMVSAYAAAGDTGTPRSFPLVVSDDISQAALSVFIAAFIFSIVSLIAVQNGYLASNGRGTVFVFTLLVLATVIVTFVFWVDRVARLGRPGNTIDKIEMASMHAMNYWLNEPHMGCREPDPAMQGTTIVSDTVGYVQRIELATLQEASEQLDARIQLLVLPGQFVTQEYPLAVVQVDESGRESLSAVIAEAVVTGRQRTFDEDPGFGLVALSEVAVKALSPAVNDPGTAKDVIQSLIRLLSHWGRRTGTLSPDVRFDRLAVPQVEDASLMNASFASLVRHAPGSVDVAQFLSQALQALEKFPALASSASALSKDLKDTCSRAGFADRDLESLRDS